MRTRPRPSKPATSAVLPYCVGSDDGAFSQLIQEMRIRAGMTFREVSERMGVSENAVHQYFYRKRGAGGTSTLRWFLRYADACGCEVSVSFPKDGHTRKAVISHGERAW
jgi:transcriptional regulator with XRE-family HTH domain